MTPLFKKLNLGAVDAILVLNPPESFETELSRLEGVSVVRDRTPKEPLSFALGFAATTAARDDLSTKLAMGTIGDAVVWLAYPKGTSKRIRGEFNRDGDWTVFGEQGFEPVRQVAIDEDWSALRFRRVEFIRSLTRSRQLAISAEGKRRAKQ